MGWIADRPAARRRLLPHVVAHDIGGGVALRTHLVEGRGFSSLLLADAVAIPPSGSPFFRFVQHHPDVLTELPTYAHKALLRAYTAGASHDMLPPGRLEELVAPWSGPVGQAAFYRQIAHYDEGFLAENEARLSHMRLPVRVLWGSQDSWLPVEVGRRLAGLIPGAQWREVHGAGHLLMLDAPVAVTYEITTWLAEQTRTTRPGARRTDQVCPIGVWSEEYPALPARGTSAWATTG